MKEAVLRLWRQMLGGLRRAPRLQLDFARPQAQSRGVALGVITVCALLLCLAIGQSEKSEAQVAVLEAELATMGASREAAGTPAAPTTVNGVELDERMVKANRVIRQFSTPWDDVFSSIEKASGEHVALLSLESDPANAQVHVGAEARNFKKMLEYLERLRIDGRLSPAILQSHQVMVDDPNKPIRFTFTASWTSVKKAPK
jgi:hypothetical protein